MSFPPAFFFCKLCLILACAMHVVNYNSVFSVCAAGHFLPVLGWIGKLYANDLSEIYSLFFFLQQELNFPLPQFINQGAAEVIGLEDGLYLYQSFVLKGPLVYNFHRSSFIMNMQFFKSASSYLILPPLRISFSKGYNSNFILYGWPFFFKYSIFQFLFLRITQKFSLRFFPCIYICRIITYLQFFYYSFSLSCV